MVDNLDPDSSGLLTNEEDIVYLTNVGANIGSTVFLNVVQSADYVIHCYVVCTTAGGGDSVPTLTIGYTDDSGANTISMNMPGATAQGSKGSTAVPVYCSSGGISYTLAGGVYTNGSLYSIRLVAKIA